MPENNRRKTPRVNYLCHVTMWATQGAYDTVLTQTSDIGVGGFRAHLNQSISKGIKIDIQIDFTDRMTPFRCKGVVVHCQQESNKDYNVGVRFESLTDLQRHFLERKISELINLENKGNP